MFAPCGLLLGTTGFARGAPFRDKAVKDNEDDDSFKRIASKKGNIGSTGCF
jgi:hypothetical protein